MASLSEHPTVQAFQAKREVADQQERVAPLDAAWLRTLCLEAGADDVGFVEIDRPALADQRADILKLFPPTKALISLVLRMNLESIRSPARSLSNLEFHHADLKLEEIAREIVSSLEKQGVRAVNPAVGFPMEMDRYPGKIWVVSHKPIAVAAGLGHMGIHRNVIHIDPLVEPGEHERHENQQHDREQHDQLHDAPPHRSGKDAPESRVHVIIPSPSRSPR